MQSCGMNCCIVGRMIGYSQSCIMGKKGKTLEPRHDKTNKMSVRPAWAEDSDQTGQMPRLIWVFTGRTLILLLLSCRGSLYDWQSCARLHGKGISLTLSMTTKASRGCHLITLENKSQRSTETKILAPWVILQIQLTVTYIFTFCITNMKYYWQTYASFICYINANIYDSFLFCNVMRLSSPGTFHPP